MKTIVFFLEEPSAKEMLAGVLPRMLPKNIQIRHVVFQGKQDLEKNLKLKLRGWRVPNCSFIIMRDQDSGDCKTIKSKLIKLCEEAGKKEAIVRIACHELESFYLGDLAAVEKGLGLKGIEKRQQNKKFRDPDSIASPSDELLKLTKNIYDKVSGSRAIAPHLGLRSNGSKSFKVLLSGINSLIEA
ncbi:MAG: DUF4276 family protein [Desulfobacula sp.]|nr:DUF4276 family protein [Desulfobacula sp.]